MKSVYLFLLLVALTVSCSKSDIDKKIDLLADKISREDMLEAMEISSIAWSCGYYHHYKNSDGSPLSENEYIKLADFWLAVFYKKLDKRSDSKEDNNIVKDKYSSLFESSRLEIKEAIMKDLKNGRDMKSMLSGKNELYNVYKSCDDVFVFSKIIIEKTMSR